MVDFPTLISHMREKGVLKPTLTQNFQMMRSEPRKEDPSINMVLRSNTTIGGDVRKEFSEDAKGHDAPTREHDFEVEQGKRMPKEA